MPLATTLQVGTNLAHSEYDVYFAQQPAKAAEFGDPQVFFQTYSKATNWGQPIEFINFPADVNFVTTFPSGWVPGSPFPSFGAIGVYVPVANPVTDQSHWFTDVAGILTLPPTSIVGLWRMDHGACSLPMPYATQTPSGVWSGIIPEILNQIPVSSFTGMGIQSLFLQGMSYVSHPQSAAAGSSNSGGVLINISGIIPGGAIAAHSTALGIVNTLLGFQDVDFSATVSLEFGVNAQGLLTVSLPNPLLVNTVCVAGSDSGAFSPCAGSEIQSFITGMSGLSSAASKANAMIQPCQMFPITPPGASSPIPCTAASQCSTLNTDLAAAIRLAETATPTEDPDSDTVSGISTNVATAAIASLSTAIVCAPVAAQCSTLTGMAPASGSVCQYKLGAARINNFPDAIEFGWFDEVDKVLPNAQDVSTVALVAAAQQFGLTAELNLLCKPPPTNPEQLPGPPVAVRTSAFCYLQASGAAGVTCFPEPTVDSLL
jgi:hypothetical protein